MRLRAKRIVKDALHRIADRLYRPVLRPPEDIAVALGGRDKKGAIHAVVYYEPLWRQLSIRQKLGCLVRRRWAPDENTVIQAARDILLHELFGGPDDLGPELLDIMLWHGAQEWDLSGLTDHDAERSQALKAHTIATTTRLRGVDTAPSLNLRLPHRTPFITMMVYPVVVKTPIVAIRHFIEVRVDFAFAAIRRSGHPSADAIIAFLYELLFLQQKTAIALHEYIRLASTAQRTKADAHLVKEETDAIMLSDLLFTYLKASVEKTIALVGAIHLIDNLESKKTHKARLSALDAGLPGHVKSQPYAEFFLEFVSAKSLDDLNNYRSGLLHKKGIAVLQPHKYAGVEARELPFIKLFTLMHEQHAKNSAMLIATLAMLTDDLVRRNPLRDTSAFAVLVERHRASWKRLVTRYAASETQVVPDGQATPPENSE